MPVTTPSIKLRQSATRAHVVLQGDAFDQASEFANRLVEERGATYLHPFDDPAVIAGQGTVGVEVTQQSPKPADYVFIPCGGGGLLSGMAVFLKHTWPDVKVIGVEPADAPAHWRQGEPVRESLCRRSACSLMAVRLRVWVRRRIVSSSNTSMTSSRPQQMKCVRRLRIF